MQLASSSRNQKIDDLKKSLSGMCATWINNILVMFLNGWTENILSIFQNMETLYRSIHKPGFQSLPEWLFEL